MKLSALVGGKLVVFLLVVGAALAVFYVYVYWQEARLARQLTRRQSWMLRVLRIVAGVLAVLALAKPALTLIHREERLPVVPMLVDESLSMSFPDSRDNSIVQDSPVDRRSRYETAKVVVERLQRPLSRTHRVRVYKFSDSLLLLRELPFRPRESVPVMEREEMFRQAPRPTGEYTNLPDGMLDALRELSGEKVSALLVLSDGRLTGDKRQEAAKLDALIAQAVRAKLPVHAIVFGSEFPLRDLRIDEVIVPPEASLGDVLTFQVKVTNQIQDPLGVRMTLYEEGKQVAWRNLTLKRGQQVVTISTIPETEGLRQFRLVLPEQPDEVNLRNNVATVSVNIVKRTLKVLLVCGEPTREYFYMVPGLLRDPVIDLSCYLQAADVDYIQQGNTSIERLPQTLKDWSQYDVAVLYDVDPNGITVQQVAGLENMVAKGGGLMVVAGRMQGLAKLIQVHAAKVRGLLPVDVDKNLHLDPDQFFEKPFGAERTIAGRNHPVMVLSGDPKINEDLWATLPQFYWYHPVEGPKPKAIVMMQTTGESGGRDGQCLMAIHRYGEGAVFYCGLDSLWLWRYPYESYEYDRFWARAIRYLGEAKLMGAQQQVSLTTDRRSYGPGEDVQITLRMLDPALIAQLAGQQLFASVTSPQKDEHMVALAALAEDPSAYRGLYRARRVGSMHVRSRQAAPGADTEAKPLYDVKHDFTVQMQSLEDVDTSADLEGMRQLAERTGGQYFDYRNMAEVDSLAKAIPTDPQEIRRMTVREVWDGMPFLVLFLVLVASEWSLRKWWGLL